MLRSLLTYFKIVFLLKIEQCLVRKVELANIDEAFELEHQEFYNMPSDGSGLSAHFLENEWAQFIQKMRTDDELWFYSYPTEYWEQITGQQGYVIIRQGKKIASIRIKWN